MRFVSTLLAPAAAFVQDAGATTGHGAWYTHPVWTAIGVIALVLIIVLIRVAERRNHTTVGK